MSNYATYNVVLEPLEEGGFTVTVPALPGCFSYGDTQAAARTNAREAIELHVEGLIKHQLPVPHEAGDHRITAVIQVPMRASA